MAIIDTAKELAKKYNFAISQNENEDDYGIIFKKGKIEGKYSQESYSFRNSSKEKRLSLDFRDSKYNAKLEKIVACWRKRWPQYEIDGNSEKNGKPIAGRYIIFGKPQNSDEWTIKELEDAFKRMNDFSEDEKNITDFFNSIHNPEKFMAEHLRNDIKSLLEANKNIILHGAPGTGKTYLAKEIASLLIFDKAKDDLTEDEKKILENHIGFVQFHQSYDYTDFVEGLRPAKGDNDKADGFERKDGVFKQFCEKALTNKDDQKNFVFIIDEINRGEMSKIFGELFFSIDPGYRGKDGKIRTQYANMQTTKNKFDEELNASEPSNCGHFFVPENVYIIGTMNDIDRSVESMDFAMRRRFAFQEVSAEDSMGMLDSKEFTANVPDNTTRDHVKAHMKQLNNKIIEEEFKLNSSYQIGGAYFLKFAEYYNEKKNEEEAFKKLWKNHLEGTLKEYLRGMPRSKDLLEKLKEAYKKEQKA